MKKYILANNTLTSLNGFPGKEKVKELCRYNIEQVTSYKEIVILGFNYIKNSARASQNSAYSDKVSSTFTFSSTFSSLGVIPIHFFLPLMRGHGGRVITLLPPTSEAGVRYPAQPQVGKLVVACRWLALYSTKP